MQVSAHEIAITSMEDFQKLVISSTKPVIVDFSAEWCGPCKQLKPKLEEAAAQNGGKWILAKIDVDEADSQITEYNGVSGIPAVFLFKDGKVVEQFVGNNWAQAQKMIKAAEA